MIIALEILAFWLALNIAFAAQRIFLASQRERNCRRRRRHRLSIRLLPRCWP
jgi:hypothetical protein